MVTAAQCKAKNQVLYNGVCMDRNKSCCNGRGYLGQVAANNGWGRCIDWRTGADCWNAPTPKQTNPPKTSGCPSTCYNIWGQATAWIPGCHGCQGPGSKLPVTVPNPRSAPTGPGNLPPQDKDCSGFTVFGIPCEPCCVFGKSLTKGGEKVADPIGKWMPIMMGGGLILAFLVLMKR